MCKFFGEHSWGESSSAWRGTGKICPRPEFQKMNIWSLTAVTIHVPGRWQHIHISADAQRDMVFFWKLSSARLGSRLPWEAARRSTEEIGSLGSVCTVCCAGGLKNHSGILTKEHRGPRLVWHGAGGRVDNGQKRKDFYSSFFFFTHP